MFGRVTRVTTPDGATVLATRVYSEFGDLLSETAGGLTVTNQYDSLRRRTNVSVYAGSTLLAATGYSYDPVSRLDTVADAAHSMRYQYLTNTGRAGTLTFKTGDQTVMTTTREYDSTNHLKRVARATASGATVYSASYTYDAGGRRTQAAAMPDNTRWEYGYDALGQVTSGKKRWDDGSFVAGQQFEYPGNNPETNAFDADGNLIRDGRWDYTWDAENQLVKMTSRGGGIAY